MRALCVGSRKALKRHADIAMRCSLPAVVFVRLAHAVPGMEPLPLDTLSREKENLPLLTACVSTNNTNRSIHQCKQ